MPRVKYRVIRLRPEDSAVILRAKKREVEIKTAVDEESDEDSQSSSALARMLYRVASDPKLTGLVLGLISGTLAVARAAFAVVGTPTPEPPKDPNQLN